MDGPRHIYDDGAVAVTGDTIVAVGPRAEIEAKYDGAQTIDARNARCCQDSSTAIPMCR